MALKFYFIEYLARFFAILIYQNRFKLVINTELNPQVMTMNNLTAIDNVLVLNASLNGANGNSHQLAQQFVDKLASEKTVQLTHRDLNETDLPHLSGEEMGAWMTPAEERTAEQAELAKTSDTFIEELKASDLVVIGMPMYNFGVPSVFKAWIDRIARAGVTFRYTENGPVGLLENKKVVIVAARGGMYAGTPKDSQTQYLKDVLAFVGIEDVQFVYAEGLAMPGKDDSIAAAQGKMDELVATLAA